MIFLLDSTKLVAQLLEPKLHNRLPEVGLEIFSSFETFLQRMSAMLDNPIIAILTTDNREQLDQFKEVLKLFGDVRIVLILPDHETETLRLGHRLYPRFVSYKDGNFDDLVSVIARMHDKMQTFPGM
ncbi:MAG: hypothetical protein P8130_15030 [Deltaproteobacteria bacterium]